MPYDQTQLSGILETLDGIATERAKHFYAKFTKRHYVGVPEAYEGDGVPYFCWNFTKDGKYGVVTIDVKTLYKVRDRDDALRLLARHSFDGMLEELNRYIQTGERYGD